MAKTLTFSTNRFYYGIEDAVNDSISVGELKRILDNYDDDEKVVFSNDDGYTYGYISNSVIGEQYYETKEEEEAREYRENMESLQSELDDLTADYEHPIDEDDVMTEEDYQKEREYLFNLYGVTE